MPEEVFSETSGTEANLSYKIDGVDFTTFGVYITKSKGFNDLPLPKTPLRVDWPDSHGSVVDLAKPRYNDREIVLDCFIKASGKYNFFNKVRAFLQAFQKPDLRKLEVWFSSKPAIYMVYLADGVEVEKNWNDGEMFGTFSIKLIDPMPIKRLLKITGSSIDLSFTSENPINIFWGDGTVDLGKFGDVSITHTYPEIGTYYIFIGGVIEDIEDFETDADIEWSKY